MQSAERALGRVAAALVLQACLSACSDPPSPRPAPPPVGLPQWSIAPYVKWGGASGPTDPSRLLAVIVDAPGGPQDTLAATPDVATFLNDRFHPLFLDKDAVSGLVPTPALLFVDLDGCLLGQANQPTNAGEWIAAANRTLLSVRDGTSERRPLSNVAWPSALAADHPLRASCPGGSHGGSHP